MSDILMIAAAYDINLSQRLGHEVERQRADLMQELVWKIESLQAERERLRALVGRANDLLSGDLVDGEWKRASRGFCRDARAALAQEDGE